MLGLGKSAAFVVAVFRRSQVFGPAIPQRQEGNRRPDLAVRPVPGAARPGNAPNDIRCVRGFTMRRRVDPPT